MSCSQTEVTFETDKCNMIKHESETNIFKTEENMENVAKTIDRDVSQEVADKLKKIIKTETKQELDMVETISYSLEEMKCKNVANGQEIDPKNSKFPVEHVSDDTVGQESKQINVNDNTDIASGAEVPSMFSEGLVQDMSILDISERNNRTPSKVVVNQQTDSLMNLLSYESTSDESDSDFEANWQLEMLNDTESVDSSDESERILCPVYINKHQDNERANNKTSERNNKNQKEYSALYSLEELDRFNLPPLPDLSNLSIDYENEEFLHIGHVKAIVESLVTIEAIPGSPSYDLDTILFIDDQTTKKPLGAIYDVIGPVASPIYCVRMKSEEEIQEKGVKLNMKAYSAPKSKYTQYVFVAELRKLKGTDASWLEDKEMPHGVDDSSGDELESEPDPPLLKRKRDSLERHQRFEKTMNRCNSIHNRVARLMDQHRVSRGSPIISHMASSPDVIPAFNPAVPPPGYVDLTTPALSFPITMPARLPFEQPFQQYSNARNPIPHMWQQDSHQGRVQRRHDSRLQNHNYWNHHAGPSRGHGQY